MDLTKEWAMESGRILKKVAPIIGITVNRLEDEFSRKLSEITGTHISKEKIHKLFCGGQWPFHYMGLSESLDAILTIAKEKINEDSVVESDEKLRQVKEIIYLAFSDFDHLSYFYSDGNTPHSDAFSNIADIVDRIITDLSKFRDNEFLYVLNKYFDAFTSITTLDLDILFLKIGFEVDCEIPVSIQSGFKLLDSPALQQWLELRNNNHKDALRKAKAPQFEKMRNNLKKRLNKLGFTHLIPLTCFIEEFLLEEKQGTWSAVTKDELDKILISKFLIGANEQCLYKLKSFVSDAKIKNALTLSNGIASLDLDKYSGAVWIDISP